MKRWPLGFLLVIAISAHAQSFWDGNAAVQRGDAAFDAGLYAMSNAFTRDTEIVVEDPASGKTTTAKVVGRIDDRLDILVLLSPAAALPLGLAQGEIVHVRVTLRKVEAKDTPILAEDTTPSTDPDGFPPRSPHRRSKSNRRSRSPKRSRRAPPPKRRKKPSRRKGPFPRNP